MLVSKRFENLKRPSPRTAESGHAVVEVSLMIPWIFFLFIGVLDFGFYAYSVISVENAARVAAIYTSSDPLTVADSAGACYYVLQELQKANNIGNGVITCGGSSPVSVTAAAGTVSGEPAAQVTVTYRSPPMIPIPGLTGSYSVTRIVTMRQ
jgi:Flp pilus assembly protein TadG